MPAIKQELTDLATKFRDHADKVDGNKRARVTSEGKCSRWSYMLAHELKPHGYVTHVVDGYYTSADEKYWETHPNVEGHGEGKSAHTWVEATKDGQTFLIDVTADQFHWDNVEQYRAVVARKDHQAYEAVQKVEASTCTAALNNDAFMLQVLNAANLTGHAFKKVSQSGKKQGYRIAPIQSTINDQAYIRIGANITSVTKSGKRGVEIRFAGITDAKVVSAKGWVTSVLKGKAHAGDAWQKLHAECEKLSQENQFCASGDRVGGLTGEDAAAVGKHLDNWLTSTTAAQRKAQDRIPAIAAEVEKLLKEKVATTVVAARDMYWHGTSGRHLRSILKDGLRPARKDSELVYLDETVPQDVHRSIKTYGGVYLTTNFMTAYSAGGRANKHSGESSLIIGVTYESRTDTALIDEDGVSQCIMHALGTGTFDELCRSQTVDAHRLYDLRSYYIPGTIHPKDYQAVLDEVHALDFEKAGEILIESLTKYHPGVANDYTHRKARVDAAIVDVFVATLCHLMEVNWTANKKYIRRYFEKNESSWDTLPEEERTKYTKQYKGYYATLDNPPSDMRNTHGRMADAVTKLTKLLPGLNEPSDDSPFGNSLRSAVPLKFSGKNRIVVVAEIATPDKENRQYTDIILHYGANNASVVHQLRTLYRERIGDTFRMMDAQGNVLHTSLDISAEWPEHLWGPQEKTAASLFNGQDLRTARKVKPVSSDQLRRTLVNHLKRTVYTREWYDKYNEYVSEEDGGPSFTKWQDWKIEDGWKLRASGHEGWRASLWTGDLSSFLGLEHRRNLTRSQDHSAYVDALDELMRRVGWFVTDQRDMRDAPPSIGGHGHKFILEPLYGERRDVPRYVYHFSAVENKDKILRNGLEPHAQSGHGGHNYPARVYLLSTFDEEHVRELAYWIANSGMSPEDFYAGRGDEPSIVVFKIDTTKLDKGTKYYDDQDVSRDAVWTYSKIPPQAIVDVVYEDTGHDEQRAANVASSEWTTAAVRDELEKIARRKYLEFRDHYSQKAPGTPVNVCMRGECFPTTYKLAAELSEHYGYDTWQAVGWYRWKGKKPKSDGSTVRSMHWWVEARKNGHTFWVDLTAIQFYPELDPNKPPPLVLDLGTAPYTRKRLDRPLHPSDFDDDGSDVEARVGTKTAALFNEQDLRETAKQRRKEWQDKSVGAKVAHVAKSIVRTMARPVESEKPGVYRLGAHYISPEGRYTADYLLRGMAIPLEAENDLGSMLWVSNAALSPALEMGLYVHDVQKHSVRSRYGYNVITVTVGPVDEDDLANLTKKGWSAVPKNKYEPLFSVTLYLKPNTKRCGEDSVVVDAYVYKGMTDASAKDMDAEVAKALKSCLSHWKPDVRVGAVDGYTLERIGKHAESSRGKQEAKRLLVGSGLSIAHTMYPCAAIRDKDDKVVGASVYIDQAVETPEGHWLDYAEVDIAVAKEHRRKGLAAWLLRDFMHYALEHRTDAEYSDEWRGVMLDMHNRHTITLAERLGFKRSAAKQSELEDRYVWTYDFDGKAPEKVEKTKKGSVVEGGVRKVMYHGTTDKFLRSILKQGLVPGKAKLYSPEHADPSTTSLQGVYLATSVEKAILSAEFAAGTFGGTELLVVTEVELQDAQNAIDEDHIDMMPFMEAAYDIAPDMMKALIGGIDEDDHAKLYTHLQELLHNKSLRQEEIDSGVPKFIGMYTKAVNKTYKMALGRELRKVSSSIGTLLDIKLMSRLLDYVYDLESDYVDIATRVQTQQRMERTHSEFSMPASKRGWHTDTQDAREEAQDIITHAFGKALGAINRKRRDMRTRDLNVRVPDVGYRGSRRILAIYRLPVKPGRKRPSRTYKAGERVAERVYVSPGTSATRIEESLARAKRRGGSHRFPFEIVDTPQDITTTNAGLAADDPFTGMSHKMWTAFRQFVEHLTWWMGNANGYHIEEMVRVWKRSKDLRKWFAAHVNLQSYPALYHGMRLSPTDNVSVGDPVPGRSAVKQWSTKRRVAEWFAGIDTVNVPEWDGGALVGGYATGSQIIVDVDRLSALCGQHLESFSSLMRKGDPVAMFSGESYEGEVLTTPNVQGTVIRVERFHEAKPEHVYAQSSTPFHGDMSIHEAGLLIAEYYSLKPGMKIKEILSRWVENGDKAYDSPKAGFWVPVEELWPYREYTWTRANARDGSSPDPDNPGEYIDHDSGAEKWDAFVVYMKDHGWDPKEPLHFYCGKNGYGKVGEGNHRLAVARMLGLTKVPVSFHFWQKVRSDGRTLPPSVRKPGSGDYADQAEDRLRLMLQQKRERNAGGTSIGSIVKAVSKILGIEGASRSRGTVGLNTQYESQTAAEFVAGHAWNVTRCEFYVVVAEWKKKGGKRVFTWTDFYGGTKEFTTTKQARAFAKKYMNVCEDKRGKHEVTMPAPPEQYTATSTR